jgi:hypothetical protein
VASGGCSLQHSNYGRRHLPRSGWKRGWWDRFQHLARFGVKAHTGLERATGRGPLAKMIQEALHEIEAVSLVSFPQQLFALPGF